MVFSFSEVECVLPRPIQVRADASGDDRLSRFLRVYLVRADSPEEASRIVQRDVTQQGARLIGMDEPLPRRLPTIPARVVPHVLLRRGQRVLWRSGRIFFPDGET
jgi:hypothetical protein